MKPFNVTQRQNIVGAVTELETKSKTLENSFLIPDHQNQFVHLCKYSYMISDRNFWTFDFSYNTNFSPTAAPADGPCTKQVSVPGRTKLECDASGFYKDVQKDSQGRRYCHDKNTGIRNTAYM